MTKGTILAVDDNPENLVLLAGILERAGYEVRAANSGRRALAIIEHDAPELILLDVEMPEMNGYEVCAEVKARRELRHVPVVFLSAHHSVEDKLQGFAAGGVDYISKPFDESEVLARVDTQLKIHRMQRELADRNRELLAANNRLLLEQQRTQEAFIAVAGLLPGQLLDDGYRVGEPIGEGGFGAVYRGEDLRLKRAVAIKVLRPSGGGPQSLERFRTEGIAACRVRHRNAVEILAAGTARGLAYLVMELLEGSTLASLMKEGPIPAPRAIDIAVQVADALTAAHAARVIHRDITPGNIFLQRSAEGDIVKVLDFGIARLVDEDAPPIGSTSTSSELVGTPEYMPPERLLGHTYDASSDIYSLGVVLFRMLTAEPVFEGQTRFDLPEAIRLHLVSAPRHLADVAPHLPTELCKLVDEMLAKEPAERPTSREVGERLRAVAGP